jgi:hypothetical protein
LRFNNPSRREGGRVKKLAVLAALLLVASAASAQTWFDGSLDGALAKAKAEGKLVLIDFYSYT